MSGVKKESFFWTSYSDLMTSLFFVMLMLFVLMLAVVGRKSREAIEAKERAEEAQRATEEQLRKIEELQSATSDINKKYFSYSPRYKKHILTVDVKFQKGSASMDDMDLKTQSLLFDAGKSIKMLVESNVQKYREMQLQYLLVIEGQASHDSYRRNYELSYERALALYRFWTDLGLQLESQSCEVLISGSGTGGAMRENDEAKNQRFLIHLVPKPGEIRNLN